MFPFRFIKRIYLSYFSKDISAVWYRRPEKPNVHFDIADPSIVEFVSRESDFILSNTWRLLENKFWLNNPFRNKEIDNKLYQLKIAAGFLN